VPDATFARQRVREAAGQFEVLRLVRVGEGFLAARGDIQVLDRRSELIGRGIEAGARRPRRGATPREGTVTILEAMRRIVAGELPPTPLATLLGYRLSAIEPGRSRVELDLGAQHANPMGTVHGGVLCLIADTAMGLAYGATLGEGESFATIELKINFVCPIRRGSLVADAVVVQQGRRIGLTECSVTDAEGRLIAKATSTCMTIRRTPRASARAATKSRR
jgi:uncharacterized protein (TIGR00369 family)